MSENDCEYGGGYGQPGTIYGTSNPYPPHPDSAPAPPPSHVPVSTAVWIVGCIVLACALWLRHIMRGIRPNVPDEPYSTTPKLTHYQAHAQHADQMMRK